MSTIQNVKKLTVGALLSAGVTLAALGMAAGTANAAPADPGVRVDISDSAGPIVECNQCGVRAPGLKIDKVNPAVKFGNAPVAVAH